MPLTCPLDRSKIDKKVDEIPDNYAMIDMLTDNPTPKTIKVVNAFPIDTSKYKIKKIDLSKEEHKPILNFVDRYKDCLENMNKHVSNPELKSSISRELSWLGGQRIKNYSYITDVLIGMYHISINGLEEIMYTFRRVKETNLLISNIIVNPYSFINTDYVLISYTKCEEIRKTQNLSIPIFRILSSWVINYIINVRNSFYIPKEIFEKDFIAEKDRLIREIKEDSNIFNYGDFCIKKVINGETYYTTPYFNKIENNITDFFFEQYINSEVEIYRDLSDLIDQYQTEHNILFTEKQKECIDKCVKNNFVLICGYPGTGKTTIVGCVIWILSTLNGDEYKKNISLMAPTGLAVLNLKKSCGDGLSEELIGTIHRMIGRSKVREELGGEESIISKLESMKYELHSASDPVSQSKVLNRIKHLENHLRDPQLIIVDEISMVHLLMIHNLKDLLLGKKVIFLGDDKQLPPIGPGSIIQSIINSNIFDSSIEFLTEIKRQQGSLKNVILKLNTTGINYSDYDNQTFIFVELSSILKNSISVQNIHKLNDVELEPYREGITENLKNLKDFISSNNLTSATTQFISPQQTYQAGYIYMNLLLRDIYNPKGETISRNTRYDPFLFRIGDRVYRTANKYVDDALRANGEVGIIKGIIGKREFNKYTKQFEDKPSKVLINHIDDIIPFVEEVSIQELYQDFALDYCKTVHKCQGSQYDNVVLLMSGQHSFMWNNDESRNLLYTAISRAKNKCYIVGTNPSDFRKSLLYGAQYSGINKKLKQIPPRITLVFKESENYTIE
jgi:energy-coupling factor transporter ATP-binding protein EcfA2